MKYLTSLLLILSFIVITIFGFAIFDHVMHGSDSGCAASTIDWTACPVNLANMTLHHISALQAFLQTLLPSTTSMLLFILFFATTLCFILRKKAFCPQHTFLFHKCRDLIKYYSQQKTISWLALFELSPSL